MTPTISFAVVGLVIGESASMIVSIIAVRAHFIHVLPKGYGPLLSFNLTGLCEAAKRLLTLAVPLSLNRMIINFLQSIEAIFIPNRLMSYGYDNATALSVYGVLTGMSLPLIFFPAQSQTHLCPVATHCVRSRRFRQYRYNPKSNSQIHFLRIWSGTPVHYIVSSLRKIFGEPALSEFTCR